MFSGVRIASCNCNATALTPQQERYFQRRTATAQLLSTSAEAGETQCVSLPLDPDVVLHIAAFLAPTDLCHVCKKLCQFEFAMELLI